MANTVFLTRLMLRDNIGLIRIPDGYFQNMSLMVNGNVRFAQGNTIDNSSSGYVAGNREATFSFTAMIGQGEPFENFLLRQAAQLTSGFTLTGLGATAGFGTQLNLVKKFTLSNCAFASEKYTMGDVSSAMTQDFTILALSYTEEQ